MNYPSDYPVVILCGGRGMRLNERTLDVPKPLVEIGGKPILWHIMRGYAAHGFKRFILCLGYKGEQIREYFVKMTDWRGRDSTLSLGGAPPHLQYPESDVDDWTVTFVDTGPDTETGGRLKMIEKYIDTPVFFTTYGDGLSDVSIPRLLEAHLASARTATMTTVHPPTHYGIVDVGEGGRVAAYREKPNLTEWVNGGFFCFNRCVFSYIVGDEPLERGPLERLIAAGHLGARAHDGFWHCMDNGKDHQTLNDLWKRGAPWRTW